MGCQLPLLFLLLSPVLDIITDLPHLLVVGRSGLLVLPYPIVLLFLGSYYLGSYLLVEQPDAQIRPHPDCPAQNKGQGFQ